MEFPRKRKRRNDDDDDDDDTAGAVGFEISETAAASSFNIQETIGTWDIESAPPVADKEWMYEMPFRQAIPFSEPKLRAVNDAWDPFLEEAINKLYVGNRCTRERGLLLEGPIKSSDAVVYTEFVLRVCALLQQETPRQHIGIVAETYSQYERFVKVYYAAYHAKELEGKLGTTWISPTKLKEDFVATRLESSGFVVTCESSLAMTSSDHDGKPSASDWESAKEKLIEDHDARADILDDMRAIKEQAHELLFDHREVFDMEVTLPLAKHPLLQRSDTNNFYSERFDALVFLDFPKTFEELIRCTCLCGMMRLAMGNVSSFGCMPYGQALVGMRTTKEEEFVLYGPLTDGTDTPCNVNIDFLSNKARFRHNLWGNALLFVYREFSDTWKAWKEVKFLARTLFKSKKGKTSTTIARNSRPSRKINKHFQTFCAESMLTILCENMFFPSDANARLNFGTETSVNLQKRMQREFAQQQHFEMINAFGDPSEWNDRAGATRKDFSNWRDFTVIENLFKQITNDIRLPMGVQHVLRQMSENNGGPVLLLLPALTNSRHTDVPFRLGLKSILTIMVTKEMFEFPMILVNEIAHVCQKEQPSCILAYTPLSLTMNPQLMIIGLKERGYNLPIAVLCQAGSLESVLMNFIIESMSGRLDQEYTLDPALKTGVREIVYRKLVLSSCQTFAQSICNDRFDGAYMPRSVIRKVMKTMFPNQSTDATFSEDMNSLLRSGDVTHDDVIRSATLCGFEEDTDRTPTYDELAEYLQCVEKQTCNRQSEELQSDLRKLPNSKNAWTFTRLAIASHRGVDVERILQTGNISNELTSGRMFKANVHILSAGIETQTPWFALPSSLTHELGRIAIHRSSYNRNKLKHVSKHPWWSTESEDSNKKTWEALGNTVLRRALDEEETTTSSINERAKILRDAAIRKAIDNVNKHASWTSGEDRFKRINKLCAGWASKSLSSLQLYHAEQSLTESQIRKNAETFIKYDIETTPMLNVSMQSELREVTDPHGSRSGRWFVRKCIEKLKKADFSDFFDIQNLVEKVPHDLDLLLIHEDRAVDMISLLMPGPQRQAQIGKMVRFNEPNETNPRIAYENTLWFATASLEHLSPLMEMLYNYEIVLLREEDRRTETQRQTNEEISVAEMARLLASNEQPEHVRRRTAAQFQEMANEATKSRERVERGENSQVVVNAEIVSLRSGRLQRPSDFMNIRFLQTTGAIFGRQKLKKVLERTLGGQGSADQMIQMIYETYDTADDITFFALANNKQRASYFERAKLTMVFRIMLSSLLDPGRPRLAPEFTEHALPLLKSGMLLGVTVKTRRMIQNVLDDMVTDLDALCYLNFLEHNNAELDESIYGNPEQDPAFSARMRKLALLCPRFMRLMIRESIEKAIDRVRPIFESNLTNSATSCSRIDNTNQ